jgi:hypothetical protein
MAGGKTMRFMMIVSANGDFEANKMPFEERFETRIARDAIQERVMSEKWENVMTLVETTPISKMQRRIGSALSGLVTVLLVFDGVMKLVKPAAVVQGFAQVGWPASLAVNLGIILLTCTALYAIPRTAVLGAILLTGYLGGAVATHMRAGDPLFSHILAPTYVGFVLWLGLYLREARLRALVPLRS